MLRACERAKRSGAWSCGFGCCERSESKVLLLHASLASCSARSEATSAAAGWEWEAFASGREKEAYRLAGAVGCEGG